MDLLNIAIFLLKIYHVFNKIVNIYTVSNNREFASIGEMRMNLNLQITTCKPFLTKIWKNCKKWLATNRFKLISIHFSVQGMNIQIFMIN